MEQSVIYSISTINTQHKQRSDVLLQLGYIWRHVSAIKWPSSVQQRIVLLRYRQIYIKTETLQRPKHVARYNPVVIIHLVFAYVDRCDDTRGCVMQF